MKLHYIDYENQASFIENEHSFIKEEANLKGLKQSLCGYLRKTTTDKTKVECKICKRIL